MRTDLRLSELTEEVLQEIGRFGICPELTRQYRRIYGRLKRFAACSNDDSYSVDLLDRFLSDAERKHETGAIGPYRRSHLRRAAFLLRDYVDAGTVEWKSYRDEGPPMPSSREFLTLYSQYIDNLKSYGRSENTIQSARNLIRQFLMFLETKGFRALSAAPVDVVASFFQHLLSAYRPTSIRTVASHIRSFLRFADGGERFLPLVPSSCPRGRPIIPILSEIELAGLKRVLRGTDVSLRDKAIIGLALRTGLRSADIVGMKLSDIDWINDTIVVRQSKTGRPFNIPVTADVGNSLSSYILSERPSSDSPYVFLRSLAPFRPLSDHSACYAIVRRAFTLAGIRLGDERKGIHLLRHTVASRMLSRGVPVTTISSVLGHTNKNSTEAYLATNERRMRECGLPLAGIPTNCEGLR